MSAVNVQPAISHKYLLNNTINALFPLEQLQFKSMVDGTANNIVHIGI